MDEKMRQKNTAPRGIIIRPQYYEAHRYVAVLKENLTIREIVERFALSGGVFPFFVDT